mmetsp:Transcript_28407/g.74896  ORF Transcript_28407/g.74896 Transcript_28407/m.74896 type:complete len:86 (+) Transcript_28407:281-538(+)
MQPRLVALAGCGGGAAEDGAGGRAPEVARCRLGGTGGRGAQDCGNARGDVGGRAGFCGASTLAPRRGSAVVAMRRSGGSKPGLSR